MVGEAKRRRMLGATLPNAIRKDWTKLNIPGHRVYVSARIDGVTRFTVGWEASTLAEILPNLDQDPDMPKRMDWKEFRKGQEVVRQMLMTISNDKRKPSAEDENKLSGCAMTLAYFGFLRVPVKNYEEAINDIRANDEFYLHVIYQRDQWVFFGNATEQSDDAVYNLLHEAYPTKFPIPSPSQERGPRADPEILARVKKPFVMRLEWPDRQPVLFTLQRRDVAHCLGHLDTMAQIPSPNLEADITRMMGNPSLYDDNDPDDVAGMIMQALFYLCARQEVYIAVEGVPTVDFCHVMPIGSPWTYQFGKQDPNSQNVTMIKSIEGKVVHPEA